MTTDTAIFLAQALPWPTRDLDGFINIHSPWLRPGTTKPSMPGNAFTEHVNAVANVGWRVRKDNDVYVCMSLQKDAGDPKAGRKLRRAMRHARSAIGFKGLWLDVDLKDGFAGLEELLAAFGVWRRKVGLPIPSFVIFTGGGCHFHWVFDETIPPDRWQPLADALAEACRREGFKADLKCTVDAARLMRVPGSFNHKFNPPRLVQIIHSEAVVTVAELDGPLSPYKGAYRAPVNRATTGQRLSMPPTARPSAAFAGVDLGDRLDAGFEAGWIPTAADVALECPWFDRLLTTGGAQAREPEWFESLKVAHHCQDPYTTAHEVSNGHASYSVGDTDAKYAQASVSAEQYGWPRCHTIQSSGATQCKACPHLILNKSPLNFVNPAPAGPSAAPPPPPPPPPGSTPPPPGPTPGPIPGTSQTGPIIPFMPKGYRYDAQGFIEHEVKSPGGNEWVRMYPLRVNGFVRQQVNDELKFGRELIYFQFEDAKSVRSAQITMTSVHDTRSLKTVLSNQGMAFKDREAEHMGRFMASFVQQLRAAQHLSVDCEPYGWSMKQGVEDAFTFDGTRFNCTGNRQIAPPDTVLGQKYRATGDLLVWKQACKLITDQRRADLNTLIACSLGAPLVQMTGHNGFVVSAYSTATGVQKTAAMRVGHAIWGDPNSMAGLDDTNNYLNTRLGMLRHLPLYVDELKFADDFRKAEVMVLGITQGKTKGRLNRASETMETLTFNTMMVTASNASLVDHISDHAKTSTAGMARIFEFAVERGDGTGMVGTTIAQAMIGKLAYNYGTAGRIYAEFLGQNVDRVRSDVHNMSATIGDIVKATTDERFWVAAIAVLIVGAQYGNELELTDIDISQLSRFLLEQFKNQRRGSEVSAANIGVSSTIERFVVDFVNSNTQAVLKTDMVNTTPGRGAVRPVVLNDVNSILGLSKGISVHAIRDNSLVRVSLADFSRWLNRAHPGTKNAVLKKMKELLPMKEAKVSLGRGTPYKRAPELVLEFDIKLMPTLDLF